MSNQNGNNNDRPFTWPCITLDVFIWISHSHRPNGNRISCSNKQFAHLPGTASSEKNNKVIDSWIKFSARIRSLTHRSYMNNNRSIDKSVHRTNLMRVERTVQKNRKTDFSLFCCWCAPIFVALIILLNREWINNNNDQVVRLRFGINTELRLWSDVRASSNLATFLSSARTNENTQFIFILIRSRFAVSVCVPAF